MKYYDVFGSAGYHSAFFTTYAFSALAFEDIPLPRLRGAGCRNIAVLADQSMVNLSFAEFGPPRYAGSLYHLAKAAWPGAFHPKLTLLIGEKKGRLLVGSANLTAQGFAGNRELLADLVYSPDAPELAPLFAEAFDYIRQRIPPGDPWFPQAGDRALRNAPWLREALLNDAGTSNPDVRLILDRADSTVLEQIEIAVGDDPIERLVVLSPYWDGQLEGLKRLRQAIGSPPTHLLVEASVTELSAESVAKADGVEVFDIERDDGRFTHAKLLVAEGQSWDHVISGSINCTLPALLGFRLPVGNAEAGIYKRVPPGEALRALDLDSYRDLPLDASDLPDAASILETREKAQHYPEPGNFELRGNTFIWRTPSQLPVAPQLIELFNREGVKHWADLQVALEGTTKWYLDLSEDRPRTANVVFADRSISAPGVVVDLDLLPASTSPPQRGRRGQLIEKILRAESEELYLLEAINELEQLNRDDGSGQRATSILQREKSADASEESGQLRTLTYADFLAARERADARSHHLSARSDKSGHAGTLLSTCLNKLIGLVSWDLAAGEEAEFAHEASKRIGTREPPPIDDVSENSSGREHLVHVEDTPRSTTAERRETRQKLINAVSAFEKRTSLLRGKRISTGELTRLRALLQIVLAYARPIESGTDDHRVLPPSGRSTQDWPRLIGRVLTQHFGTIRALQALHVEDDDEEHLRVLEYLATAYYASQAAKFVADACAQSAPIRQPLAKIASELHEQMKAFGFHREEDRVYIHALHEKLNERFSSALGCDPVPPP